MKKTFILLFVLCLVSCQQQEPITKQHFQLGTFIDITLYDAQQSYLFDELFDTISQIENSMTLSKPSEMTELNAQNVFETKTLSPMTCRLLDDALTLSHETNGHFNLAIEPLSSLWDFNDQQVVPHATDIFETLPLLDYEQIEFERDTCTVSFSLDNMGIDLGGIAKGYAADLVHEQIIEANIDHALINIGGNILAHGTKPNNERFNIGVQDPNSPRGVYLGVLALASTSIATSGTYERSFEENGVLYHHLLDSQTGYPIENELQSVSIVSESATQADGLSTAVFSLGLEAGLDYVLAHDDIEAIFVTKDHEVLITPGLSETFMLTDDRYTLETIFK